MCEVNWAMVLEYLKVFFSWPPIFALVLTLFFLSFKTPIGDFIDRIKEVDYLGARAKLGEKEQEVAAPPELSFPGSVEARPPGAMNATVPLTTPIAGETGINWAYSPRAKALFPSVDPAPVVQWMHRNPGPSFEDYVDKMFQLNCERIFNVVFGTQIGVLILLSAPDLQETPTTAAALVPLFEQHLKLTGRTERKLNEFLGFLETRGLIVNVGPVDGPLYRITEAGRQFLLHIKQYYPFQWNAKEF